MSHIHIPDGILPPWLWILGFITVSIYFYFSYFHLKKTKIYSKLPLISIMSALMLLTMSLPLPFPIPYHINLAVLTGIILGPYLAIYAIFTSNIILAFMAHGGITVTGLNTIVIGLEAIIGYFLFKLLFKKSKKIFLSAFCATFLALILSALLMIGIVYTGTRNLNIISHHHQCNCKSFMFHQNEKEILNNNAVSIHDSHNHDDKDNEKFNIERFLTIMFIFGIIGWVLEASFNAFIVSYIYKVKPEILDCIGNINENS